MRDIYKDAFAPNLRAVSSSLSADNQSVDVFAHSFASVVTIQAMARKLNIENVQEPKDAEQLDVLVDQVNKEFSKKVDEGKVSELCENTAMESSSTMGRSETQLNDLEHPLEQVIYARGVNVDDLKKYKKLNATLHIGHNSDEDNKVRLFSAENLSKDELLKEVKHDDVSFKDLRDRYKVPCYCLDHPFGRPGKDRNYLPLVSQDAAPVLVARNRLAVKRYTAETFPAALDNYVDRRANDKRGERDWLSLFVGEPKSKKLAAAKDLLLAINHQKPSQPLAEHQRALQDTGFWDKQVRKVNGGLEVLDDVNIGLGELTRRYMATTKYTSLEVMLAGLEEKVARVSSPEA